MIDLVRRILAIFERHGLWDEGVELIGSWCFYLYQRHLGVKPYPFKTQDIDVLLPYPYRGHIKVAEDVAANDHADTGKGSTAHSPASPLGPGSSRYTTNP